MKTLCFLLLVILYACVDDVLLDENSTQNFHRPLLLNDTTDCGNQLGNGATIIDGPDGPMGADYDNPFRSLTVDPTDENTIFIGTERNGFLKSTDGGANWERLRYGLRHTDAGYPEVWNIAFAPSNPEILYAATLDSPGPVVGNYPSNIGGLYKSSDGGQSWGRFNCGLDNSRIAAVQISSNDPSFAVIGVEGGYASFSDLAGEYFYGGLYHTDDGGDNWMKIDIGDTNDIFNGFWQIEPYGDGNKYITFGLFSLQNGEQILSQNVGFLKSEDAGFSWQQFAAGLRDKFVASFAVSADGQTIFANERDSYWVHISEDGGNSWNESNINQANGPIAVSPTNKALIVYAGHQSLYRTTDSFTTFEKVIDISERISDIVFAPSNSNIVYLVTGGYLFYKSEDAGETFSLIINLRTDVLNIIHTGIY